MQKNTMQKNKTLLIITDGIGHNNSCEHNAFCNAKKPTYDFLFENVPYSMIHTSGMHVGLPDGQMGNSEVGHMSIGSGRVLYQDLVKINMAIEDGSIAKNSILKDNFHNAHAVHLVGLLSDGGVHSHIKHIMGLAHIAANEYNKRVFIHVITDGRDVAFDSALSYIQMLEEICCDTISIASIAGRYYTMDRDNRWERVQKGYNVISKASPKTTTSVSHYIQQSYESNIFDEFIEPTAFDGYEGIHKEDSLVFCNFRSDRMREISNAFGNQDFQHFKTLDFTPNIVTMTEYDKNLPLPVLFPKQAPKNTLAEVISNTGCTQFHTAETEKYAHVTFFFNGGIEEPYENETRVLIPSPKVDTYDKMPQMSAPQVGQAVCKAMENSYDFIVVNFANGDMVGHTGNYDASIQAVQAIDHELGILLQKAKEQDYSVVLTSDHGNCEMMKDKEGKTLTNHTLGDVYCFVVSHGVDQVKAGGLNNIAPTVLKLMGIQIPSGMDAPLI